MGLVFELFNLGKQIGIWNNQINDFIKNHLSNPFVGYLLFFGILAVLVIFIRGNYQK